MRKVVSFTLAIFLVSITLSGCAKSIPPRQELTREVPSLKHDLSRVYFFYGNWYTSRKMDLNKYGSSGTIYINGSNAGLLNKKEYIILDLQPGNYEIYWQPNLTEFDLSKHKFEKTSINLSPGETYFLAANMRDSGGMAKLFGPLGVLAADCLYVDTIDKEPLSATSIRLVDYKVLNIGVNSPIVAKKTPDNINSNENHQARDINEDVYVKLEKLKKMYENKLITKEEYDSKRQELVGEF